MSSFSLALNLFCRTSSLSLKRLSVVLLLTNGSVGLLSSGAIASPASPIAANPSSSLGSSPSSSSSPSPSLLSPIRLGNPPPATPIAQAQPLPPPQDLVPPRPTPSPVAPPPLPPPDTLLQPSPTAPGAIPIETPGNSAPQQLTVERFNVTGSTVFNAAEFAEVTKGFVGRPISLAELFQARSAITQLYLDRGYITSGAYIPPQKLQDGVVEIRVVEGELEDIRITGTRRLNPNYVRSRLALGAKKPLNRARLLEALQLLQVNPLISTVSAELSSGSRPGTSLLEVKVAEAKTFGSQITLDNGRSPSVGTFRRQVQLSEANLLGLGDGLSISYANTDGSNEVDLNYTLPINPRNGTVSFSYGNSSSRVIEEPFDQLDIDSKSHFFEVSLRQPIFQSPTQEFALGLSFGNRESRATLLNGDLPFPSLGADNDGKTRVSALRFFQEYTKRSSVDVFAARSQFSFGLNAFNSTINDEAPDSRFVSWRGQLQYVRLLAPDTLLLLRSDLQLANRSLLPVEQFGVGGINSVRGYRQDQLLTDQGLFASAELRVPVLRIPQLKTLLQVVPFIDVGVAGNRTATDPDPRVLAAAGLGLRLQVSDRVTARLEWGRPLVSVENKRRTWQEDGLYFSIVVNPF